MPIPNSFQANGWLSMNAPRKPRVMMGTEGESDSGKTEFILSAPGPGVLMAVDRNFEGVLNNAAPPNTRRDDWAVKIVTIPLATQESHEGYKAYWKSFYSDFLKVLEKSNQVRSFGFDGDSDSWELQRLVEFGKLTQVPEHLYSGANAARRAMIARLHDSGKIVIATNKLKIKYVLDFNADGTPKLDSNSQQKRKRDPNGEMESQGFRDQDYLWQIRIRHLFKPSRTVKVGGKDVKIEKQWGLRIIKCKPNKDLETEELWGSDCNFRSLVELIYPQIDPDSWYE